MNDEKEKVDKEILVNFRVSASTRERMKAAAKKDKRSMAMWLRHIIEEELEKEEGD